MQDNSNKQTHVEKEINILQLNPQTVSLSQNVEQLLSLETSSISKGATIASTSAAKVTESLKEIGIEKKSDEPYEKAQEDVSASTSKPSFETSVETETTVKKVTESLKDIDIAESSGDFSEGVLKAKVESSLETSKETKTIVKKVTESLKDIKTAKSEGDLSHKVQEGKTESSFETSSETEMTAETLLLFSKLEEGKTESVTLKPTSKPDSSTSQSDTIVSVRRKKFPQRAEEMTTVKNSAVSSERKGEPSAETEEGAATNFKPDSSIFQRGSIVSVRRKNFTEQAEGASAATNLVTYLDSIDVGAIIAYRQFLIKRRPYLKKLLEEAVKLRDFMEYVNNMRHEFRPCSHTSLNCLNMIPDEWHKLIEYWEAFLKQVSYLIETTNIIIEYCEGYSLKVMKNFNTYLENLFVVSDELCVLEEICEDVLDKYRPACFNYDNYLFLLHLSTMNPYLKPLQDRLMQESGKFSTFEVEINEQIREAEEKVDLF